MADNAIFWKLNVEPEHLESSIRTLFPLSQPLELWLYHQFDDKRPFSEINPRWPPSTSWKINVWNGAHTVRYKYTFSTKTTMTSPILIYFLQLNITLTLLSRWLPYTGVNRINKTGCSIQNEPEQLESSITCSQHFFKRTRLNISWDH